MTGTEELIMSLDSSAPRSPVDAVVRTRPLLTNRQCGLFMNDIIGFGYPVTFDEIRRIANEVHAGTNATDDPVAMIMCKQIDEALDAIEEARRK